MVKDQKRRRQRDAERRQRVAQHPGPKPEIRPQLGRAQRVAPVGEEHGQAGQDREKLGTDRSGRGACHPPVQQGKETEIQRKVCNQPADHDAHGGDGVVVVAQERGQPAGNHLYHPAGQHDAAIGQRIAEQFALGAHQAQQRLEQRQRHGGAQHPCRQQCQQHVAAHPVRHRAVPRALLGGHDNRAAAAHPGADRRDDRNDRPGYIDGGQRRAADKVADKQPVYQRVGALQKHGHH